MARFPVVLVPATVAVLACQPCQAQVRVDSVTRSALLAQVVGPGGCVRLDAVETYPNRFFPGVEFLRGTCVLEHGAVAHPLVARDSAGMLYILNSESSFHFLTNVHRPLGLDSSSVVQYAFAALVMQGKLPESARLLTDRRQAPDSLCERAKVECGGLFLPRAEPGGRAVYLTAITDYAIYSAGPIIVEPDGHVYAVVEEWSENGMRLR